jgi:hypothetical protein
MLTRRALLTQDISSLFEMVQPYFGKAIDVFMFDNAEPFTAWKWIIETELELIYGMVSKDHERHHEPYVRLHDYLNSICPTPLSRIVTAHIGAPCADLDHLVEVEVTTLDLKIYYTPLYTSHLQLKNYIKYLHHAHTQQPFVFGPKG